MAGSRKWLLIGAVVALPLVGAVVLWVSRGSIPAARRHAVFDQAWEIIGTNYYDREMNGLDWPAVHDQFEPQLRDVHDDSDLYWKLLKPMAELLESSHVQLNMPPQPQADGAARAEVPASTRGCDGMWWTPGRQNILPRVRNVEPDSILYAAGVRKNWRLIGRLQNKDQPSARIVGVFMTPAGKRVEVPLAPESGGHPVDASPVMHDFLSLQALLKNRADPWTELKMNSLGITVWIGQVPNAPSVVDVEPGSDAARAGIGSRKATDAARLRSATISW